MTYDFEKMIDAALSGVHRNEGGTEEVQETLEYEETPMSAPAISEQRSPVRIKRDRGRTEVNVSFPPMPIETSGQPIQINCYVDASVHVEQTTVNHTTNHRNTAIGVGDDTVREVVGAIAKLGGILKGL